jgi:hypothetical protein
VTAQPALASAVADDVAGQFVYDDHEIAHPVRGQTGLVGVRGDGRA